MTRHMSIPAPTGRRTALVIGATGGFGCAVAQTLAARGWSIRALHRHPEAARAGSPLPPSVDWMPGDAMLPGDVIGAAADANVIVHAANPPGYRHWRSRAMPMLANTVGAARRTGARILFPGNVYNFGPDAWPVVTEVSPQHPVTRKGSVRVEMEALLENAAAADEVRTLVVRAGDYFGPHAPASWLANVMIKPGRPVRAIVWPGGPGGHAFAYLPDLAEAAARLLDVGESRLADFETVNFGGHWCQPGVGFAEALVRAAGRPDARIKRLPWWLMRLVAPVAPTVREALEMRYLWDTCLRLDNSRLVALIGDEPHTPLDEALRRTLAGMGCSTEQPAEPVGDATAPAA